MKNINPNTILQIVALLFLVIIGYMTFNSGSNWKIIKSELDRAREELKTSKETLVSTKSDLEKFKKEFEKMRLQKDLLIHKRDSLIFDFQKKNAKDWEELQRIKDSIKINNDQLAEDKALIKNALGIN
ncbi:hypothetical protein D1816_13810 [Aquimarina sp. AD10]|uniref:hypothetical protein n=1 Tax=Aquimarina sp. AD10 TaxID=1714849 RepID=UPI000E535957|nr:hypothetical protein [Aquimarina sp. AD10]AXT61377.1 hypothetical protein D1816_13810 [Aquimarina sp. AD10]RKN01429.1 hypothetical protein D7033_04165 [Aquimarina sp. AD10]